MCPKTPTYTPNTPAYTVDEMGDNFDLSMSKDEGKATKAAKDPQEDSGPVSAQTGINMKVT